MFKFMKSKKGFTLVELMIVVVIMAILVAVAVPIFSAVTKNAQQKTCASNRREIVSQVSNYCMGGAADGAVITDGGSFQITSDGKEGTFVPVEGEDYTSAKISPMFQELPYCPAEGVYSVTITSTNTGSSPTIEVTCTIDGHA